mgnify:CR=1 FL=1
MVHSTIFHRYLLNKPPQDSEHSLNAHVYLFLSNTGIINEGTIYNNAGCPTPEINVAETLKEVRRALLEADVNYKTAKEFTKNVKEKAIGQNVLTNLKPGQLLVKIVKDPGTNEEDKPKYMRAFDFHSGPEKELALQSLLLE